MHANVKDIVTFYWNVLNCVSCELLYEVTGFHLCLKVVLFLILIYTVT